MRSIKLDAYKGLACIFVVFIHCMFPGTVGTVVKGIARFAVPLFFMSAGFYCFCKDSNVIGYALKKVKHVVLLLIVGSVPWLAYEFIMNCFVGNKISISQYLANLFAVENFTDMLLWNNLSGFLGGGGVLWFVVTLIYCYLGYVVMAKLKAERIMPLLIVLTLVIHQLVAMRLIVGTSNYNVMYETNYWLFGFPMFTIGYMMRKYDLPRLLQKSKISSRGLIMFGIVASIVECLTYDSQLYIGSILVAVMMICDAQLNTSDSRLTRFMAYIGNKLSFVIYVMHYMIMVLLDKIVLKVLHWDAFVGSYIRPVVILFATLMFAQVYVYLKEKIKYVYSKTN